QEEQGEQQSRVARRRWRGGWGGDRWRRLGRVALSGSSRLTQGGEEAQLVGRLAEEGAEFLLIVGTGPYLAALPAANVIIGHIKLFCQVALGPAAQLTFVPETPIWLGNTVCFSFVHGGRSFHKSGWLCEVCI